MTPEEKSLLERTYKLAEENHSMLKSIRRSHRLSAALRLLYWVVILLSGFAAYYLIQPYVDMLMGVYDKVQNGVETTQQSVSSLQNTLNSFTGLLK